MFFLNHRNLPTLHVSMGFMVLRFLRGIVGIIGFCDFFSLVIVILYHSNLVPSVIIVNFFSFAYGLSHI